MQLACLHINKVSPLKIFPYILPLLAIICLFGCGEEPSSQKENIVDNQPSNVPVDIPAVQSVKLSLPNVIVEELDQSQEFYKEQHTTSFSYVRRKNWTSYTAGKNGLLTKILLFGKANLLESPHYGLSMGGFVRAKTPDSGPKLGEWNISREEIVSQLSSQGLQPRQAGWITIQMLGDIPQVKGVQYFLVCDYITEGKAWFGEFAFAEANPYTAGSHWLNPNHDLVMRTYVGKTEELLKNMQIGSYDIIGKNTQSEDSLPAPISQNLRKSFQETTQIQKNNSSNNDNSPVNPQENTTNESNTTDKKSMFDRLFKSKK